MLSLEHRVEVETQGQFNGLARGTRGGNDNDPAVRMGGVAEGFGIGRKVMIAGGMHGGE